MSRVNMDPPTAHSIDCDELVDALDPDPGFEVVYPARHFGERNFVEYDPYEWIEDDEES